MVGKRALLELSNDILNVKIGQVLREIGLSRHERRINFVIKIWGFVSRPIKQKWPKKGLPVVQNA